MKKSETNKIMFTKMNSEELSTVSGGSFAYDLGRFIRYMGLYYYEGGGAPGTCYATLDFAVNMINNS